MGICFDYLFSSPGYQKECSNSLGQHYCSWPPPLPYIPFPFFAIACHRACHRSKAWVIQPGSRGGEEPYKGVPKLRLLCGSLATPPPCLVPPLFSGEGGCWHYHIPVMAILGLSRGVPDHKQTGIKLARDPLGFQSLVVTNVPKKIICAIFSS